MVNSFAMDWQEQHCREGIPKTWLELPRSWEHINAPKTKKRLKHVLVSQFHFDVLCLVLQVSLVEKCQNWTTLGRTLTWVRAKWRSLVSTTTCVRATTISPTEVRRVESSVMTSGRCTNQLASTVVASKRRTGECRSPCVLSLSSFSLQVRKKVNSSVEQDNRNLGCSFVGVTVLLKWWCRKATLTHYNDSRCRFGRLSTQRPRWDNMAVRAPWVPTVSFVEQFVDQN